MSVKITRIDIFHAGNKISKIEVTFDLPSVGERKEVVSKNYVKNLRKRFLNTQQIPNGPHLNEYLVFHAQRKAAEQLEIKILKQLKKQKNRQLTHAMGKDAVRLGDMSRPFS